MSLFYQSNTYMQTDIFAPDWSPSPVPLPDIALSGKELEKFLNKTVLPAYNTECDRIARLDAWAMGKQPEVRPLKRNSERYVLQRLARTPWIPLMISTFAQQMIVDGYHKDGAEEDVPAWESWMRNKMTAQQIAINRAVMSFGYTYVRVTQGFGVDQGSVKPMANMRAMDPRDCFALYADPYADEWAQYVLERLPGGMYRWWLPNGDFYELSMVKGRLSLGPLQETLYGTPPFVRFYNQIDLRGRCWGDVEPVIDLAARIDKTAFDRMLVQHFNSFKVRWATGLEQADSPEGVEQDKIRLSNEDILVASDVQARFGTLDETSLAGFIDAYKADLEAFAAVMQLPPNLLGQVINVAADALDGARRQTYQRLFEKQTVLAESYSQMMRFAALLEGREEDANDFTSRVHWQDVEVRSLAQFADAWGKIVTQLGVPKWAPWSKIPGVTQTEVEGWKEHLLDDDPLSKYLREVVGAKGQSGSVAAAGSGGPGGPNSIQNQRPIDNRTGVERGQATSG